MSALRWVKLVLFMTCRDAAPLICRAMDQPLASQDRAAVGLHLAICPSCRRYRGQLTLLRRVLMLIGSGTLRPDAHSLPPHARSRLRAELERA